MIVENPSTAFTIHLNPRKELEKTIWDVYLQNETHVQFRLVKTRKNLPSICVLFTTFSIDHSKYTLDITKGI